jgi:hypothetical protein
MPFSPNISPFLYPTQEFIQITLSPAIEMVYILKGSAPKKGKNDT